MAKIYGKWEGMGKIDKPNLVIGVPSLRGYLLELGRLTKDRLPPKRQLTMQRQVLVYLMGGASGFGFGSLLWGQGRIIF